MDIIELSHPVSKHYLTVLRDKTTSFETFRLAASKLSYLLIIEATKQLHLDDVKIETPLIETNGKELTSNTVAVSVLRAGLGLIDGPKDLIPNMTFGYIGVQRNEETAEPENYYENLPEINDKDVFILEPMLATGGSLSFAIDTVKKYSPRKIYALTVISSPEGIKFISSKHPDITLLTASVDEKLNENYYIVPGLGDMGDRLFGTV